MNISGERRNRIDRRQRDSGPPNGCADRRRLVERRLPQVEEAFFSDAEWEKLFGGMETFSNVKSDVDVSEEASEVLDRAGNRC